MTASRVDRIPRPVGGMQPQAIFRALTRAPYALLTLAFCAVLIAITVLNPPVFAWDFRALYEAGAHYLHLRTPYVSGSLAQLTTQRNYVYPLPFAALLAPVSLIPYSVAATLFLVGSALLLFLTLRLLGVRDWRVYAAVAVGLPTASAVGLGTISPLLAFLLALLWRFRDEDRVAAPVLAVLVLAKLFLWPVGLWLLLTRRFRTVATAAIGSAAAVLLSALPFGPGVLSHYVSLLRSVSALEGPTSFSLSSLGSALSGSSSVGTAVMVAAGVLLVYAMVRSARLRDEERIFRLSIVAALALSPIVWNHYLVLLFVPLALTRPRFSPLWLAGAWLGSFGGSVLDGTTLGIVSAAVWVVIVLQGGVVTTPLPWLDRSTSRFPRAAVPLASGVSLWVALFWFLGAVGSAVPAVAALRPPSASGSASGTAALRLLRSQNEICWTIVTSGLQAQAHAAIVDTDLHKTLVHRSVSPGRSAGCAPYGKRDANLAMPFARGQAHLRLTISSAGGRPLLDGRVVSDYRDLGGRARP